MAIPSRFTKVKIAAGYTLLLVAAALPVVCTQGDGETV